MLRGSWAAAAEQWQAWWGVALWLASARHTLCWELLRRDSSRHPLSEPCRAASTARHRLAGGQPART